MYCIWSKVCGHVNITSICVRWTCHSKPQGLICCYTSIHSTGKSYHHILEPGRRDLLPFSHKSICEVRHWCWAIRPGSFQFIPKVFDGVEVRALCRPVKFFHNQTGKKISLQTWLCAQGHFCVETEKGLPRTVATKLEAHYCLKYYILYFDIHGPQRMTLTDLGDCLTFPLVPLWGWHYCFLLKCLNYWMDSHDIWFRHSRPSKDKM